MRSILTEINLHNNCRKKCAILTSAPRGATAIIVSWRIQMNYPTGFKKPESRPENRALPWLSRLLVFTRPCFPFVDFIEQFRTELSEASIYT